MNVSLLFPAVVIGMITYQLISGKIRWRGIPAIWTYRREQPALYWMFIGIEAAMAAAVLYMILRGSWLH
jgi:hypothetical protein